MRRMLDPKELEGGGGELPSTITFDKEGNRKVGKNLGVDGKLTLKSLVSSTNPDGDITKELGGGSGSITLYRHFIRLIGKNVNPVDIISFDIYNTNPAEMEWNDLYKYIKGRTACSGYVHGGQGTSAYYFVNGLFTDPNGSIYVYCTDNNWSEKSITISRNDHRVQDEVHKVI